MKKLDLEHLTKSELSLWYNGRFEDGLTDLFIEISDSDSPEAGLGKSRKKISFLMAESFQNIIRHGTEEDTDSRAVGSFGLSKTDDYFYIFSSNMIDTNEVQSLESKLTDVNRLNKDELKTQYRELLKDGNFSQKGGAGLGLIEMARKTGRKLKYSFEPKNEQTEFNLQLEKALSEGKEEKSVIELDTHTQFVRNLRENGVLMLFNGDFDRETTDNISKMLMGNTLKDKSLGNRGKVFFHVATEMLQNITRHGQKINGKTEGTFIVQMKDDKYQILTRNYFKKEDGKKIQIKLNRLKKLSRDELKEVYKKQLKKSVLYDTNNAGVGIIDIVRNTNGNINHSIAIRDGHSELTLTATIEI